jgi:alkylation response protein AidB-like acyl-CoA dehydrogenase
MSDSHDHWIARAQEVAGTLAADALDRDRANAAPDAEVKLLKSARLPGLLIPESLGGGGQTWRTALAVVREIARADGSVAEQAGSGAGRRRTQAGPHVPARSAPDTPGSSSYGYRSPPARRHCPRARVPAGARPVSRRL